MKTKELSSNGTESKYISLVAEYLPIEKIANGIIYTKDHRYVKIIEVSPINFMLRNPREQRSIIYSFISYLKISPVKIQFKVIAKSADINRHIDMIYREMEQETDYNLADCHLHRDSLYRLR